MDEAESEFPAWRRVHQCAGVFVCPWHEVELWSVPFGIRDVGHRMSYRALGPELREIAVPLSVGLPHDVALDLAKEVFWLLVHGSEIGPLSRGDISKRLWFFLRQRGWIDAATSRLRRSELDEAFRLKFGEGVLGRKLINAV
jgi:hypothetical protein